MYIIARNCTIISIIITICINASDTINTAGAQHNNPWVYNVPQAFLNIPVRTRTFLNVWTNNIILPPRYTQTLVNRYEGIWGGLNHFQSIKRFPAHLSLGNYVAILGTDPHTPEAQLFIAQLPSQNNNEFFTKNTPNKKRPADQDKLIKKISLSAEYWHAGSMDMAGDILVIPLYKNEGSQILFYTASKHTSHTPEQDIAIENLNITINRHNADAIAVALTRLQDGYYLVAIWTHGLYDKDMGLDFYCSKDTDITHGFDTQGMIRIPTMLFNNYKETHDFQNINFVNDANGRLYLIALENAASRLPPYQYEDKAHLFEIKIRAVTSKTIKDAKKYDPNGITAQLEPGKKRPYVIYMMEKHMFCKQSNCSFDSGATVYIPDQQHIVLYSLPYWLTDHGKQLTFAQYSSIQKTYPA